MRQTHRRSGPQPAARWLDSASKGSHRNCHAPGPGAQPENGNWSESPLLINPGGPGAEATSWIAVAGHQLQKVAGTHHDIIGFDPRGIGGTFPPANCFLPPTPGAPSRPASRKEHEKALFHRYSYLSHEKAFGFPNSTDASLARSIQRSRTMSVLCKDYDYDDSIFKYMGAPHVAQDMRSIVQAWERWTSKARPSALRMDDDRDSVSGPYALSTRGKLVYWGWSYGTFLGATYASMFRTYSLLFSCFDM